LIEAPDMKAIQNMHNHAHGEIPNRIIEVEAGIVESFLGRIEDPKKSKDTELNIIDDPAFRTIMNIALKKLKPLQTDPLKFKSLLNEFNREVINILNTHEGNLVKQTPYQYLVSFKSVSNAVHAAFEIQSLFTKINSDATDDKITLKIGLAAGVPVTEKQLLFEDAIKLAERMCAVIDGDIIISSEVEDLYKSENVSPGIEYKKIIVLSPADENFLIQLMDYTEKSWNNVNLKVENFCKPLGVSKSQLYRKMIILTGKSPNTFIKEYRLSAALQLLNKKTGNISEIAFDTGFSSPSYFSKCFQKRYGLIPSDYISAIN
jgi:AraC-like DNA-binding protein